MSDRSTPETDAVAEAVGMGHFMVDAEFARKLERERDHARAEAERWRDNWKNGRTMLMISSTGLPWENNVYTHKTTK